MAALKEVGGDFGFVVSEEYVQDTRTPGTSTRLDVVFSLPESPHQSAFGFEIDQEKGRWLHNYLKIWINPVEVSRLPAFNFALLWGNAAKRSRSVFAPVDIPMPLSFLQAVYIESENREDIVQEMRSTINDIVKRFSITPIFDSAFDILSSYQPLLKANGIYFANAHLGSLAELAYHFVRRGDLELEIAARIFLAKARLLQRTGFHAEAAAEIKRINSLVGTSSSVSCDTKEGIVSVESLLSVRDFSTCGARDIIHGTLDGGVTGSRRSQFIWRCGLFAILSNDDRSLEKAIDDYKFAAPSGSIPVANEALLRCLRSMDRDSDSAFEQAQIYGAFQEKAFNSDGLVADGTIHGVVTSLYLKIMSRRSKLDKKFDALLSHLNNFRDEYRISSACNGIRELKISELGRQCVKESTFRLLESAKPLIDELSRGKIEKLRDLSSSINCEVM